MTNTPIMQWLQQVCSFPLGTLHEMLGDASFRRYFRLESGQQSYVVMDASLQMDCFEPYVAIDKALSSLGVAVPEIMAHDLKQGYMLISDFGDRQYLKELKTDNADKLYKKALDSLSVIQACKEVKDWPIPAFDQKFMQRELDEFKLWFLERLMKVSCSEHDKKMLQTAFSRLTEAASQQTQVFIHRDYHSANLMVLPAAGGEFQAGILDFQDACTGPVTYDLVSLVRDCYIDWPNEKVYSWTAYYYDSLREKKLLAKTSLEQFKQDLDWMGMQRHMKAAFIFARKYLRDRNKRYLQYLPRTLNYVLTVSEAYPEFQVFHGYLRELLTTLPAVMAEADREELNQCAQ